MPAGPAAPKVERIAAGEGRNSLLLLLTAAIWGMSFVAQRSGMSHMGPFLFNAIRFALGSAVLLPIAIGGSRGSGGLLRHGVMAGTALFAGASLQQAGLQYTDAGNAGFVTGLYLVMVPLMGSLVGRAPSRREVIGAAAAAAGLYLLTTSGSGRMASGDMLVLAGALFWSLHILLLDRLSPRHPPLRLAAVQFATCALLSACAFLLFETGRPAAPLAASAALLYSGLVSVGVAFTLQVVAQRRVRPSAAAVVMSLEAVFAAIGGALLLGERIPLAGLIGCSLMLVGMVLAAIGGAGGFQPARRQAILP